jgi:hypothetical protein
VNRTQTLKKIEKSINEGKSVEAIYQHLLPSCPNPSRLSSWIAMFPTKENREKYKKLNLVLFSLLLFQALLKILSSLTLPFVRDNLLWLLIVPLMNILFAIEVWKMRRAIYNLVAVLEMTGISKLFPASFFTNPPANPPWLSILINILFCLFIAVLSFYTGKKIFPKYKPISNASQSWKIIAGWLLAFIIVMYFMQEFNKSKLIENPQPKALRDKIGNDIPSPP